MIGLLLVALGTLGHEASNTLGKKAVASHHETIYTVGFLSMFATAVFLLISIGFGASFRLSLDSLPTLSLRIVLELVVATATLHALSRADRSTMTFFSLVTIPLLLVADLVTGYAMSGYQIAGALVLALTMATTLSQHTVSFQGAGLVITSAVVAVGTISLYKYNISHFNSVAAEQLVVVLSVLVYFLIMDRLKGSEHPWHFLRERQGLAQAATMGISGVLTSFAFLFAAPSVILSAKRAFDVLWSILAGNRYFGETKAKLKLLTFGAISVGLVLLAL